MRTPNRPRCGGRMKKNGTTSAGRTRWRCGKRGCGASVTHSYNRGTEDVQSFLDWLLSTRTQRDAQVPERTLRCRNGLGWSLWPPCPMDGQVHDVVHLDGIHLGRNAVVLICILSSRCFGFGHVVFSVLVIGACWSWLIGCWCGRT